MTEIGIEAVRLWMKSHRNDIIEDMRRIVNIRSVSEPDSAARPFGEGCRSVLETMLALASEKGFDTENFDYYGGRISLHSGTNGKEIGIWSHLDVVPEGTDWTFPPYEMTVIDDFLVGRGVQDNKSSAVGMLYVLLCLREFHIPLHWNYSLYVGCSEENTMDDVAYLTTHVKMPEFSLVADCGFPVCYGEKGNLSVEFVTQEEFPDEILSMEGGSSSNSIPDQARIVFRAGFLTEEQKERLQHFDKITVLEAEREETPPHLRSAESVVKASGRAAHIINPEQGESAVTILAEGLISCGLGKPVEESGEDENPTSGNARYAWLEFLADSGRDGYGTGIGMGSRKSENGADGEREAQAGSDRLVGGVSRLEMKDGRLRITADYRYPVLDDQGICSDGSSVIEKLQEAAKRYGLTLTIKKNSKAMYCPPESPVVKCLTNSYQKYSGYDNPAYMMSGGTYARKLPNGLGFGMALPGKKIYRPDPARPVGDFHQADESICISQLLEAMAIYAMCLIDLDKEI